MLLVGLSAAALGAVATACSDDGPSPTGDHGDDGAAGDDAGSGDGDGAATGDDDASSSGRDATGPDGDAGTSPGDASSAKDANGPGEAGAPCSFNRDCSAALRCECDETAGCACAPGPRGTGRNGIDPCDGGDQCASSLCVEGPGGAYVCSDECVTPADCTGALPLCTDIAFVGRICIRDPGT
jgi:hypothetical protein